MHERPKRRAKGTMHEQTPDRWQHHHTFGTDESKGAERRTWWMIGLTAIMMTIMMTVEIAAGMIFGSMALLADGWHMGTHAAALGITVFAYVYARRHADNPRYGHGCRRYGHGCRPLLRAHSAPGEVPGTRFGPSWGRTRRDCQPVGRPRGQTPPPDA